MRNVGIKNIQIISRWSFRRTFKKKSIAQLSIKQNIKKCFQKYLPTTRKHEREKCNFPNKEHREITYSENKNCFIYI